MTIKLDLLNLVIRRSTIEEKYPGGWEKCISDYKDDIERGKVWFDDDLFRDGSMSSSDMKSLVNQWEELGFRPFLSNGLRDVACFDCCIIDTFIYSTPTLPCDWIDIDEENNTATLKGKDPTPPVGCFLNMRSEK